ncbi:MAG: TonB-dependent receptor [Desulfobacteraceae bacterium]|nr:TonB-dependent receptor [Desulfobacteraceae bacterium]
MQEVYNLEEIVVQDKAAGVEAAIAVEKIDAEDIKMSGARNVVEAMTLLPGIEISTGGSGVARMNIRGFRTRHVLLLLDGIPINSAYDQQFDASLIPVEHIARIEMTLGPSSVLYGQGGAGGVVNIFTKKGYKALEGMAGYEIADGKTSLKKASLSSGHEYVDFFISGSSYKRDFYPLSDDFIPTSFEDGNARENSFSEKKYVFGNVGYTNNESFTLGLTFSLTRGAYGVPGGVINDGTDDFAPTPKYVRVEDLDGASFQVSSDYRFNDFFSMRAWIFYNTMEKFESRYDTANFYEHDIHFLDSWKYRLKKKSIIKGFTVQPTLDLDKKGLITFGISAEKDQWKNTGKEKDGVAIAWPPRWNILYPNEEESFHVYSMAVEYQFSPTTDLGITIGTARHSHDREKNSDKDYSILLGSHYDLLESVRLKAAFNRNIRFPSIRQLYDNNAGNIHLKTERVSHYTAGIDIQLPLSSSISLNVFKSIAKNFIEKDKFDGHFQNFDDYIFQGGEISTDIGIFSKATIEASYSYLHTEDRSDSGKDELQYRPAHRYSLQLKYDFDFGFTPYVSILHVTDQYYYAKNGANIEDLARKKKLNDYTLVNVKLTQKIFKDTLTVYVGAENIFDENYEQSYGLPQPGRVIYSGAEIRF